MFNEALGSSCPETRNNPTRQTRKFDKIIITPTRSMSTKALIGFFIVYCLFTIMTAIPFLSSGAYMVIPYMLVLCAAVGYGFYVNMRYAASREEITLSPYSINIARFDYKGKVKEEYELQTYFTTTEAIKDEEYGLTQLYLKSRGKRYAIGDDLSIPEREDLLEFLMLYFKSVKSN